MSRTTLVQLMGSLLFCALSLAGKTAFAQSPRAQPVQGPQAPPSVAPAVARQQGPAPPPRAPQAPFQLTTEQQAVLMNVLRKWEERSNKIKTLSCEFTRWDYDPVFGKPNPDKPGEVIPKESSGVIKYAAPDKGLYRIKEGEHWVCDGASIWEYNYEKKQLIERRLPPEMQGKAIADGPLPFLFGAEADKLMSRYFLRLVTPPNAPGQIWLEAYPKYQLDAANFRRATLILDQTTMLPHAMEINLPNGKSKHVHQFGNNVVNDLFRIFKGDFSKPDLPAGWIKMEEPARAVPAETAARPGTKRG